LSAAAFAILAHEDPIAFVSSFWGLFGLTNTGVAGAASGVRVAEVATVELGVAGSLGVAGALGVAGSPGVAGSLKLAMLLLLQSVEVVAASRRLTTSMMSSPLKFLVSAAVI